MIYCAYGNIVNFSRTSQIHFSWKLGHWNHLANGSKQPQNSLLPLEPRGPPLHTSMLGPTPLTMPNDSSIGSWTSTQLCNKCPTGYNETPHIHPQNYPFPFDDNHSHLIHPLLDRSHSPPQTASAQPFCHDTLADRQTDRWSRWETCTISVYARQRRIKNTWKCV